ncbi:CARDB domain-containing protein [Acinetobacter guillouiae]|uniref:CARDB domain-containing protein n=1 Tax=Acinetobacter guillouiae TaxID=106649 RepID=UPI00124FBDE3|nr:CARDB domain-containing protein [Acinetobacter guillouiae]
MDTRKLTGKLSAIAISILLASCGGGSYYDGNNGGTNNGNNGGGTTISAVNITNITLYDVNNSLTSSITATGVTAKVKVTDKAGNAISGAIVTFSGTGVVFGTTNGAVLTNADGEASISVKPESLNINGAYQISATTEYNGTSAASQAKSFTLQAANIVLVGMAAAASNLESGASTNITLKTQDANTKVNQNNVTVNFSASCGTFEPAIVASSNQGDVTTSYKAIGTDGKLCEGKHTIIASGSNIPESKVEVSIAATEANSLVYTTTNAVNLGIKNSGSAASGQIEFTLYANGTPAANKDVNIELVRAPEDLSFISLGNRAIKTVKSDPNGKVVVTLYPGNKPGPVEIKATLVSNNTVTALSKNIAVSTGRVTQNSLSLSVSKNSLQNAIDGDAATITARMVDRTGNPVPDGTVISFVSEGGKVEPNCSSIKGECSVVLSTQNPRPLNNNIAVLDNRVTVLAYVEGDKSFTDIDGDNLYTKGVDKLISNIGSFFRDDNENNQYDNDYGIGEFLYNRAVVGNKAICAPSTIKQPNIADTCDENLDTVIRQQLLFAFSENTATYTNVNVSGGLLSFRLYGNSMQSVPMPTGTSVSVTAEDNTKDNNLSCSAELLQGSSPVANVFDLMTPTTFKNSTQVLYGYRLKECALGDTFKVSVAAPDGKVSTIIVAYQ